MSKKTFRKSAKDLVAPLTTKGPEPGPEVKQEKEEVKAPAPAVHARDSDIDMDAWNQIMYKTNDALLSVLNVAARRLELTESSFLLIAGFLLHTRYTASIPDAKALYDEADTAQVRLKALRCRNKVKIELVSALADEHFNRKMAQSILSAGLWLASLPHLDARQKVDEAIELEKEYGYSLYRKG